MSAIKNIARDADTARAEGQIGTESAQVRALLSLRELILSGELAGGTRIAELAIVERIGVSRTPRWPAALASRRWINSWPRPAGVGWSHFLFMIFAKMANPGDFS